MVGIYLKSRVVLAAFCVGLAVVSLPIAQAHATDQTDLTVGLKTLPLLNNKITGTAVAAVVFDPANADSKADAEAIKAIIDGGLEAPGGVKLTSLMVPVSELAKLSGAKIGFVTKGACTDAASSAAASGGVLTISTDIDCVKAGKSIIGVVSKPSVEIYYSKAAGDAAKIGFSQAFSMLAKQV